VFVLCLRDRERERGRKREREGKRERCNEREKVRERERGTTCVCDYPLNCHACREGNGVLLGESERERETERKSESKTERKNERGRDIECERERE